MKVLLMGEFSSLHKYLKEGLLELGGIEVTLVSNSDGWKEIGGVDIRLPIIKKKSPMEFMRAYRDLSKKYRFFKEFDVVQYINPNVFPMALAPKFHQYIRKNNKCVSLVAAGSDYRLVEAYSEGAFEYYSLKYDQLELIKYDRHSMRGRKHINNDLDVEEKADVIIPSLYEYWVGYRNNHKTSKVIPFPINIDQIEYKENKVNNKIVFFHGLIREESKGTKFIRAAMERLKKAYPNDVEIIIDGHMPFRKYMEIISRTNVVADQCCGYGYGINACVSMAQGKVVLSGCRKEVLDAFGLTEAPIFPVKPDVDVLFEQMAYIVEHKQEIPRWGYESRKYVEKVHDYRINAQKYVEAWKATGRI